MQLRYVFSELGQGLRRNLSMHVAVVLTLFVSLTLVGLATLFHFETQKTEKYLGSELQITVFLCNKTVTPNCDREVSPAEEKAIETVVEDNPEVAQFHTETQAEALEKAKELVGEDIVGNTKATALRKSIWIELKRGDQSEGIVSAVAGLDGVHSVQDHRDTLEKVFGVMDVLFWVSIGIAGFLVLAALLLVANTIRLAAFARRREIGIMRLVGASSLYISLPFLMEALVTAALGVGLAALTLGAFMWFGVHQYVSDLINFLPWIGLTEYMWAIGAIALLGPLLTVIPTLVLTRKYLKV